MAEYADEADYAVEPVSDPEKLVIAEHMLMSSPPGQFWDVLTDVRKLLPEGLLDDARAQAVAKAYNAREGVLVQIGDHASVLAAEGAVAGGGFKDSLGGALVTVDHVSAEVTGEGPEAAEEELVVDPAREEQRLALQEDLEAYRASHFSEAEKSAACVFAKKGGGGGLVAYVSSRKYNLRNWWSGMWCGRYTVAVGDGSAEVCGTITVRGHYFEAGNIQLQTSKEVAAKTVAFSNAKSLAEAVVSYIRESESALHEGLEAMYDNSNATLRSMRRTKPITADSFTWNVAKIRMRNTLTQAASGK
eukprot:g16313.t1